MEVITPKISIVGVGGLGCATLEKLNGRIATSMIALNTDARSLLNADVENKILIGKSVCKGRSTGNNIRLGEAAAISDLDRISGFISGFDVVILMAGVGGGTGSGATPIIAQSAKSQGSKVIAFVNLPFSSEGKVCLSNANTALLNLKPYCDLIIVIENDRYLKIVPELSINEAFSKVNEILFEAVHSLFKIISELGLETVMPLLTGYGTIGHSVSPSLLRSVEQALESPLICADIRDSGGLLIDFKMETDELRNLDSAMESIYFKTNDDVAIMWVKDNKKDVNGFEVMLLFTGIKPYIMQ